MNKKKIITITIAFLAIILFLVLLVSASKPKKTLAPENNLTPTATQKEEPKNEPEANAANSGQLIAVAGQIVAVTDQGLALKTESGDLNLKFKADTMVMAPGSNTSPTSVARDKSALVAGKTVKVVYEGDTMEIQFISVQ